MRTHTHHTPSLRPIANFIKSDRQILSPVREANKVKTFFFKSDRQILSPVREPNKVKTEANKVKTVLDETAYRTVTR